MLFKRKNWKRGKGLEKIDSIHHHNSFDMCIMEVEELKL
jgi:hypothetical protein